MNRLIYESEQLKHLFWLYLLTFEDLKLMCICWSHRPHSRDAHLPLPERQQKVWAVHILSCKNHLLQDGDRRLGLLSSASGNSWTGGWDRWWKSNENVLHFLPRCSKIWRFSVRSLSISWQQSTQPTNQNMHSFPFNNSFVLLPIFTSAVCAFFPPLPCEPQIFYKTRLEKNQANFIDPYRKLFC